MINKHIILIIIIFQIKGFVACNNDKYYEGEKDPVKIKEYNNKVYYASEKLDSLAVISHITEQKLQEVYDLAILATENKSNKEIDTLIISQLRGYFPKKDTVYVSKIVKYLDSLQVKYIKIELEKKQLEDTTILNDSVGVIYYKVHYYNNKKKHFSTQKDEANYILKKNPEKFKSEFKFYFTSIGKLDE